MTRLARIRSCVFEKNGFPSQRLEEWKDTNLTKITGNHFESPNQKPVPSKLPEGVWENRPHIVFNNGFCETVSVNVEGVKVAKLSDALKDLSESLRKVFDLKPRYDHSILDLNTSMAREGVVIQIQKQAVIETPIYLVYRSSNKQALQYRNLILAQEFSKAKIVEIFLSDHASESWTVPVTQIQTSTGANIEHVIIQDQSLNSHHTGLVIGRLENDSRLATYSFSFGGNVVRNDIHMILDGQGAQCVMDGLYVASQSQIMDHHTTVSHLKPHCSSFETYKGVLMDDAHGIFQGKIVVAENAQKTDANQMNQNLLLSTSAKVNTAPQLEILADDVKCAHGATIGKLDEDQVFYLRSRGIDVDTAKQMLISAYAGEVISKITIPEVVDDLERKLARKIGSL
ncbi:MAG: Fe-S cluster assembly protein SufD [Bdellovibrionota bacterium]